MHKYNKRYNIGRIHNPKTNFTEEIFTEDFIEFYNRCNKKLKITDDVMQEFIRGIIVNKGAAYLINSLTDDIYCCAKTSRNGYNSCTFFGYGKTPKKALKSCKKGIKFLESHYLCFKEDEIDE